MRKNNNPYRICYVHFLCELIVNYELIVKLMKYYFIVPYKTEQAVRKIRRSQTAQTILNEDDDDLGDYELKKTCIIVHFLEQANITNYIQRR